MTDAPTKCEFLQAERNSPAEIHLRMSFMSDSVVCKWYRKFKDRLTNIYDKRGQGGLT